VSFEVALINRLKTGSIKNVYFFGDDFGKLHAPYIVIKPISGGDRILYQIFVHMALGSQVLLKNYVLIELTELFKEPVIFEKNTITVRSTGQWFGWYVDEGDNTLAMSRDFFVPIII